MNIRDFLKNNIVILDGGMGSLLQKNGLNPGTHPSEWNLTHPDIVVQIHRDYFDAGSNVAYTNTFGISSIMYDLDKLETIIAAAINNARQGAKLSTSASEKFVALDIGPTGKLLKPYGDWEFEDIVNVYKDMVRIGCKYDPDLIVLETLNDSYETKAALLAVKECCDLPVFVTNSYGMDHKLMTGGDVPAMIALLEGMGADAIGVNCSLGPKELEPVVLDYLRYTKLPVILKPNAGLPKIDDGKTVYDLGPDDFADQMIKLIDAGVNAVGGCCGTTPEYIKAIYEKIHSLGCTVREREVKDVTIASSYTHAVTFGDKTIIIGERINPTGKKKFRQALYDHDINYVLNEGVRQVDEGADALDVNVGIPDVDEPALITELVRELQAIIDLPLQIDSSDPKAIESALRIYNGKAIINSVNGDKASMERVFPLAAKYGGVVIALTLDENGVPATTEGRMEIARRIVAEAAKYGIAKKDLVFDALTMTISADTEAGKITLETVKRIKEELGCHTILGVSNISFGLPRRDILNSTFLQLAVKNGLDAAIFNPGAVRDVYDEMAATVLTGKDAGCANYIAYADSTLDAGGSAVGAKDKCKDSNVVTDKKNNSTAPDNKLKELVIRGLKAQAVDQVNEIISHTDPLKIINEMIIPALNEVGDKFEKGKLYLPQLMISADTAGAVFDVVKTAFSKSSGDSIKVIMATVKGDVHDIGKNICKLLLESYGFEVIDLGKDVAKETILETIDESVKVVGLSALMTTTLPSMEETVACLKEKAPWVKIAVGGAVLTQEFADRIGADIYTADALTMVQRLKQI